MDLASPATIKQLCRRYHIYPSARKGQSFLINQNILNRILASANIKPDDNILEIGPGLGILTDKLLKARKVASIELDKKLYKYLQRKFNNHPNLELVNKDILKISNAKLADKFLNKSYRLIANIPYQITGKIVKKFVSDISPKPKQALILVQKEVGERICASAPKMNLLSISVQLYAKPKVEFIVPKSSFWPVPDVDSCLLNISNISQDPLYRIDDIRSFWRILKIGFSSPRKQLHNNLSAGLKIRSNKIKQVIKGAGFSEKSRPQELEITQWLAIMEHVDKFKRLNRN